MNPLDRMRIAYRAFRAAPLLAARLEYGIDERPEAIHYEDLYSTSAAVYACIKLRADTLSRPILKVYRRKNGQAEELIDHPLRKLIDRMNPFWTRSQLWRQTETDLLWHGNAFWGLETFGGKAPVEIWRMRPDWMRVVPDRRHYIKGYLYQVEGIDYSWSPQEVIHFRYANPLNEYWGLSPLMAARYAAELGIDATKFNRNFFLNASTAATALISKVALSKEQADDLTRRWEQAFVGVSKAHRTAVLSPDLTVEKLSINQRDAEWMNAMKWSLADIARVFRVPEPLVGEEKAVYKNIREAETAFWHECQIPELLWMEEILNAELIPLFDDSSLFVAFDISMIEAIQADIAAVIEGYAKYLDRGVMTINEVRQKERLGDDVPWGDVAWMPMNLMPMGRTGQAQKEIDVKRLILAHSASLGVKLAMGDVVSSIGITHLEKPPESDPVATQIQQRQMDYEVSDEIEDVLVKFFETEAKAIARAYSRSVRQMGYDWERWRRLEKPIAHSTRLQLESAAERAFVEVETIAEFNLENIRAMEWAEDNATVLIRGMAEETKANVTRIVNEGISQGWARDKLANALMEHSDFGKARAQMVARTETQRAFNQGNLRGYKESEVVDGKYWLEMGTGICNVCLMNTDAGVIGMDANFPSGHDAPPAHPNCRCRLMPKLKVEQEEKIASREELTDSLETNRGLKQAQQIHDAHYDEFEDRFGMGTCGNMSELLRQQGVGQIEVCTFMPDGARSAFEGFGHYYVRTPKGKIVDITNPFKGKYLDVAVLSSTEAPELVGANTLEWLRRHVLEEILSKL